MRDSLLTQVTREKKGEVGERDNRQRKHSKRTPLQAVSIEEAKSRIKKGERTLELVKKKRLELLAQKTGDKKKSPPGKTIQGRQGGPITQGRRRSSSRKHCLYKNLSRRGRP